MHTSMRAHALYSALHSMEHATEYNTLSKRRNILSDATTKDFDDSDASCKFNVTASGRQ